MQPPCERSHNRSEIKSREHRTSRRRVAKIAVAEAHVDNLVVVFGKGASFLVVVDSALQTQSFRCHTVFCKLD